MKTLMTAIALVTFVVAAASATPAAARPNLATVNGQVVGADPDINIRAALLRDPCPVGD